MNEKTKYNNNKHEKQRNKTQCITQRLIVYGRETERKKCAQERLWEKVGEFCTKIKQKHKLEKNLIFHGSLLIERKEGRKM